VQQKWKVTFTKTKFRKNLKQPICRLQAGDHHTANGFPIRPKLELLSPLQRKKSEIFRLQQHQQKNKFFGSDNSTNTQPISEISWSASPPTFRLPSTVSPGSKSKYCKRPQGNHEGPTTKRKGPARQPISRRTRRPIWSWRWTPIQWRVKSKDYTHGQQPKQRN